MAENNEIAVRMGELVTGSGPHEVIACVGIGSCIALVLADAARGVVGVAHVVMPEGDGDPPAKYATAVVPELIARTVAAGASRVQLRAAIVGGASMFNFGTRGTEDQIGARNERVVRAHLALARIPIVGEHTGGTNGRSLRITAGVPLVARVRTRAEGEFGLPLAGLSADAAASTLSAGTRAASPNQTCEPTPEVVN